MDFMISEVRKNTKKHGGKDSKNEEIEKVCDVSSENAQSSVTPETLAERTQANKSSVSSEDSNAGDVSLPTPQKALEMMLMLNMTAPVELSVEINSDSDETRNIDTATNNSSTNKIWSTQCHKRKRKIKKLHSNTVQSRVDEPTNENKPISQDSFESDAKIENIIKHPYISLPKQTGEPFLQVEPCSEVLGESMCRGCRSKQRSENTNYCRFKFFRKLRYTETGVIVSAGFLHPIKDPSKDELNIWMADDDKPTKNLTTMQARYLLEQLAVAFCSLYSQEQMAKSLHMAEDKDIAWKRTVDGVHELCDRCATTIFNHHWSCEKCGFVVCIDCYKLRKNGAITSCSTIDGDVDSFGWLLCNNDKPHEQNTLMMVQIIAGDSMENLNRRIHETRDIWTIPRYCGCSVSVKLPQSILKYPDVPHSWLCDGRLLRLLSPAYSGNLKFFQEQWIQGQPVVVSGVTNSFDMNNWRPESFSGDCGEDKSDLMESLPLGDYTKRNGHFNLTSYLPDCFVQPDLGPKMYSAHGSALHPTKGTTNLHDVHQDCCQYVVETNKIRPGTHHVTMSVVC